MSFQKFKTNSYCNGQKHYSGTKNIVGEITYNKKTCRESKLLVGKCVVCDRQKSMIVSDKTIQAEGLGSFFKTSGTVAAKAGKKIATNALKNPGKFLEIGANFATAAANRNPQPALSSLLAVIFFYHTGKSFYFGNFV